MTAIGNLKEPFIDGGIKNPYFFNGRLLTAEALQDEQSANSSHRRQLGRIMGEGVAQGMEVSIIESGTGGTLPTVSVSPGLALNREGRVVELTDTVHLKLVREGTAPTGNSGLFVPCGNASQPDFLPTGTGVYILVAAPAGGYEGKAPMHYLGDTGKLSGCNYKYEKDGVRFRLVLLDITNTSVVGDGIGAEILSLAGDDGDMGRSQLRNLLAHLCLGTEAAAGFAGNLFQLSGSTAAVPEYGPLDVLRESGCLEDADVPLALILWTQNGLEFVDMWSVRRKPHSPYPLTSTPFPLSQRRHAELEAAYLQFQEQMSLLYKSYSFQLEPEIRAVDYFRFLPAAGFIPMPAVMDLNIASAFIGSVFFDGLLNPVSGSDDIDEAALRHLIGNSLSFEPVRLKSGTGYMPGGGGEMYKIAEPVETERGIKYYFVSQNKAFKFGDSSVPLYAVYTAMDITRQDSGGPVIQM